MSASGASHRPGRPRAGAWHARRGHPPPAPRTPPDGPPLSPAYASGARGVRGVPASAPRGPPPVPRKRPARRRRPSHDPSGRGGLRVGARIARRDRRPAGLAVRASTPHTPGTSTPHTPGISIEIPSVKRHSVSSPVRCFLRLLYGRVQLSLRPSRCCAASVRAVGWDAMVPAHVGDTKERTAPIIQRLSNDFDVVRPNSRNCCARRSRFGPLDSRTVLPCYPARLPSVFARGRSCCASYGTPSRHIA